MLQIINCVSKNDICWFCFSAVKRLATYALWNLVAEIQVCNLQTRKHWENKTQKLCQKKSGSLTSASEYVHHESNRHQNNE